MVVLAEPLHVINVCGNNVRRGERESWHVQRETAGRRQVDCAPLGYSTKQFCPLLKNPNDTHLTENIGFVVVVVVSCNPSTARVALHSSTWHVRQQSVPCPIPNGIHTPFFVLRCCCFCCCCYYCCCYFVQPVGCKSCFAFFHAACSTAKRSLSNSERYSYSIFCSGEIFFQFAATVRAISAKPIFP